MWSHSNPEAGVAREVLVHTATSYGHKFSIVNSVIENTSTVNPPAKRKKTERPCVDSLEG